MAVLTEPPRAGAVPLAANLPAQTSDASPPSPLTRSEVEAVLRSLPSHGWTRGWTGRRERARLVLSATAGLADSSIAALTAADITIGGGTATIRTTDGTTTLEPDDDGLICAPCALARWLHALDMTVLYESPRVIAAVIARAAPLTADSPHLCQGSLTLSPATLVLPLLPASHLHAPDQPEAPVLRAVSLTPASHALGGTFAGRIPAQRTALRALVAHPRVKLGS